MSRPEPREDPQGAQDDLLIREATPEDLLACAEVFLAARAAAVAVMPPVAVAADVVRRDFAAFELDRKSRQVWVAEAEVDGGPAVVGYAELRPAWLDDLYVDPAHSGRGIGSALLETAKASRPHGFCLWVFESNRPAREFYRRRGLVELDRTDGSANEERCPDVRMAWPGHDPVAFLRGLVDDADLALAELLAQRFALTAAIQAHKEVPGHAGRDPEREREIARRMAAHVPGVPADSVARIIDLVISEGLDASPHR